MRGKHSNVLVHWLASLKRDRLRSKIANAISWQPLTAPDPGCTVIVGVCSRMPDALVANMRCLSMSRWPELKRVLLTADCTREEFPAGLERTVVESYPDLHIEFRYYTAAQAALAKSLELPYVYSWLSWCIALREVQTRDVLFHDYDALILGPTLESRYRTFVDSGAKFQGISWYKNNGLEESDHLATTFEAFVDATWLRSMKPIEHFNKLRVIDGRSIDMDTTLDAQQRFLSDAERTIVPMDLAQLVHPSQMVHQYTMFRHSPGAPLPCFSIPMIPFFADLGGNRPLLEHATNELESGSRASLDFLNDGTKFNFTQLSTPNVDWALKQILQALIALDVPPDPLVHRYGTGLYRIVDAQPEEFWRGDFTPAQRLWIAAAA